MNSSWDWAVSSSLIYVWWRSSSPAETKSLHGIVPTFCICVVIFIWFMLLWPKIGLSRFTCQLPQGFANWNLTCKKSLLLLSFYFQLYFILFLLPPFSELFIATVLSQYHRLGQKGSKVLKCRYKRSPQNWFWTLEMCVAPIPICFVIWSGWIKST